jgi:ATP-dependent helicase/nuclease subunit B
MNVFTIPPGQAFVDILAAGLLHRAGGDPLALSSFTVLLPTRRAIRSLKDAFLRLRGDEAGADGALLLPRLMTLGDLDEDELVFQGRLDALLPPAIDPLKRQLLLSRLVMAARADLAWDQAARLAQELARFLDQMQTQKVPLEHLDDLVPDDFASHWGEVLKFLGLLATHWPRLLESEGALDPVERRNRMLAAQAEEWRARPPDGFVVAAGSTGSIPATADLLKVIASLERGAVILPGLDRLLDEEGWAAIDESHPQFGMKKLLEGLDLRREEVKDWGREHRILHAPRMKLISESFRPADTTEAWRSLPALPRQAIVDFSYLEAPDPRSEALSIALLLREVVETPGKTAALITPDRNLARRVASELERFKIAINDSSGQPLQTTGPGVLFRLSADAVRRDFAPFPLLALLKHPLCGLGMPPQKLRSLVREFEIASLRGPRPAPGLAALTTKHDWLAGLDRASQDFARLLGCDAVSLSGLVAAHIAFCEALAATEDESGAERLWRGEAGEAALDFMGRLLRAARGLGEMPGSAYPALLEALMEGGTVRPAHGLHPRLFIWGPLEARLQQADLVIMGGMNEGVWPAELLADPWLSRPMRKRLGLESPERRIGLMAQDAAQAMAAPRVVLSRSLRDEGAPTQPSRFVQRLEAVMNATGLLGEGHGEGWRIQAPLDWAMALDHAERITLPGPPAPCPPLHARPDGLSVTRIETWMRDPYALYAQKILRLKKLDPIDADPGAADLGTLIHKVLEIYARRWPQEPSADIAGEILAIGNKMLQEALDRPGLLAFWRPRLQAIADFVAGRERSRAAEVTKRLPECQGKHEVEGFTLVAKADRIDLKQDGSYAIIDYKTGTPPGWKQVKAGFAPQLPLEAAILMNGGFEGTKRGAVSELAFWHLAGGRTGGRELSFKEDIGKLADEALEGLRGLVRAYRDPNSCYHACPTPGQAPDWNDYEHLERRLEWQSEEEGS